MLDVAIVGGEVIDGMGGPQRRADVGITGGRVVALGDLTEVPPEGDDDATCQRRLALWREPRTIVGGSGAGAHLDMLATFSFFPELAGPVVRDRQLAPVEQAVKLVTDDAARAFGLRDRGRLAEGWAADVVVFGPDEVATGPLEIGVGFPASGLRLYAGATGIEHVLVNGTPVVERGELTGARPGIVLRSARNTDTVLV